MNISYNWLKEYLDFDLEPEEVAAALTSIGLETGGVEEVQTIKGGLEGLVIGEVLTCEEHPKCRWRGSFTNRMWRPERGCRTESGRSRERHETVRR